LPAYAAASEAELAAVVSGHRETAEAAARKFGNPRVLSSWEDAVADPEIDAIDICTPNALHAPIAIAAAESGKHVIVEKPMATTLEDADAMVAAARKAGVVLMVAHNLRFVPVYHAMHDAVASGAIGRPFSARGVFMHAGPDEFWGATADWFWEKDAAGGGSLLDLGIHMIDLLRWMIGRPVLEVVAMTSRVLKPTFADDNAFVLMRFEGDVLASVQSSWSARPFPDRQITIHGERGHIAMGRSAEEPLVIHLRDGEGSTRVVPEIPAASPAGDPFVHFVQCIRDGVEPLVNGEDGRASLEVALAAYESAETGRLVNLRPQVETTKEGVSV
jgi:predicted dehydrogenase